MTLLSVLLVIRLTIALSDFNCTSYEAGQYKYSSLAISCSNKHTETMCRHLFGGGTGKGAKLSQSASERPTSCYQVGDQFNSGIKKAALATCAQYCGFCCQTPEYSCENVQFPRIDCETITDDMCRDEFMKPLIASDCPNKCGFCLELGCSDATPYCSQKHCLTSGLEHFVASNCQKTCGLCAPRGIDQKKLSEEETMHCSDVSLSCEKWSKTGYCQNAFYSSEHKKNNCAKTCKLC